MQGELTIQQVAEITGLSVHTLWTIPYAGFPTAVNALNVLKEVEVGEGNRESGETDR